MIRQFGKFNEIRSTADLINSLTNRIRLFGLGLFLLISLGVGSVFMQQTHLATCALIESKLGSIAGPLAREVSLGETEIAQSILRGVRSDLLINGAKEDFRLELTNKGAQDEAICSPHFLDVTVTYPLRFAGETKGFIRGTMTYFPFRAFSLLVVIIFVILTLSLRSLGRSLMQDRKSVV